MMRRFGLVLSIALVVFVPGRASAEWQIKPFLGVTFGGGTTFVDPEHAAGGANLALGVSALLIGNVFGVEADIGHAPGFFQSGDSDIRLVTTSSVTTLTGNIVAALPRRIAGYGLRPYVVGGAGLMHLQYEYAIPVADALLAADIGGGVTGFLTDRIGLNWDVRHFGTIGGNPQVHGQSVAPEQLSFWRASMALAIRY